MKIRTAVTAALAAGSVLLMAGCATASDSESMHTRCIGADKVFIIDSDETGGNLFVLPDHDECRAGGRLTR